MQLKPVLWYLPASQQSKWCPRRVAILKQAKQKKVAAVSDQ